MNEKHKPDKDGILQDGVSVYPADAYDMASYGEAQKALARMPVPIFHHAGNRHERLYIAGFDGTWNDAENDPEHRTNLGEIREQINKLVARQGGNVRMGYVEGVGTQDNFVARTLDGAIGYTYDARLERMYEQLITQSAKWLAEDPNAQIRIADIGFSRGAEQAAGFARLVHERGIQDPSGVQKVRGDDGRIHIEYTKPPLVPPGQIAQAVGLFDPVGTGAPRQQDRRLPPSVISGLQLKAEDERRNLFQSTSILDQGLTADGRFLVVTVAGAHSDVGGGYHRNGLSIRSGNLMLDYLNALSDTPYLHKRPEPSAPGMNVVHRAEEGLYGLYRTSVYDRDGERGVVEALAPPRVCRIVPDCRNAEPRDAALAAQFSYHTVAKGPVPAEHLDLQVRPASQLPAHEPDHPLYRQSLEQLKALGPQTLGFRSEQEVRNAAGMLAFEAKASGLRRIDHVLVNRDGTGLFAVQGAMHDPAHHRIYVDKAQAASQPLAQSTQQLQQETQRQAQAQAREQQPPPQREPPVMTR